MPKLINLYCNSEENCQVKNAKHYNLKVNHFSIQHVIVRYRYLESKDYLLRGRIYVDQSIVEAFAKRFKTESCQFWCNGQKIGNGTTPNDLLVVKLAKRFGTWDTEETVIEIEIIRSITVNLIHIERENNDENPFYPNASAFILRFRISMNTTMKKLKVEFAQRTGLPLNIMIFGYNGKTIMNDDTPLTLGLDNQIEPNPMTRLRLKTDAIQVKWSHLAPPA